MGRHLVWEAVRAQAAGRTRQAVESIFTGLRLLPSAMLRVPFDRRRARRAWLAQGFGAGEAGLSSVTLFNAR
jgi:hypothetical protein